MNLPEYKKRVEIANAIYDEWKSNRLIDIEFDSLLKALYVDVSTKQQDRVRLGRFLESQNKNKDVDLDDDPHERLS